MPSNLSQSRAANQTIDLPIERTMSSIPRGDTDGNWEYPSPQQMYNAMLRKGYDDTPQDAVESMVAVHNFLNEGAWAEIVEWERRFAKGLGYGWQACRNGEEGSMTGAGMIANEEEVPRPRLRRTPQGSSREVRYVIDYYSAPPEPTGEPVFYLDVRPAVDRPSAAIERMMRWGGDVWHRASGASVRQIAVD
ncbi:MAG: hypothetical protein Q9187_002111 [Circinaria calcarea]